MSLFEREDSDPDFPTEPAFTCPVEVRDASHYGDGHKGVYCIEKRIPKGTKLWVWTERVLQIHHSKLEEHLEKQTKSVSDLGAKREAKRLILRQGFVLPNTAEETTKDDFFYSNPTDAGRFTNHSKTPNCGPDGALRDIEPGDEITMDYAFHGNPKWYQDICEQYDVLTEHQVAQQENVLS